MSDGLLMHVRDFYDTLEIGVVLIGNRGLTDRWTARRAARRHSFVQLRGRIGPHDEMRKVRTDNVIAIARHHSITDAGGTKVLREQANFPGGMHNVAQVLTMARALQGDGAPSADAVRKATVLTEAAQ